MGKILGCSEGTIRNHLHKYNIPVRTFSEAQLGTHQSIETRKQRSKALSGKNNPNYGKGFNFKKEIIYNLYSIQEKSVETTAKIMKCSRKAITGHLLKYNIPIRTGWEVNRGKKHHNYGKPPIHGKGSYYKGIFMRSSWEVKIAKWLDKHNIRWSYEPRRFILKDRTYAPDFYLTDRKLWWEPKGWFHERHQETIRQFRELYPNENILVLTKPIYESIIRS